MPKELKGRNFKFRFSNLGVCFPTRIPSVIHFSSHLIAGDDWLFLHLTDNYSLSWYADFDLILVINIYYSVSSFVLFLTYFSNEFQTICLTEYFVVNFGTASKQKK